MKKITDILFSSRTTLVLLLLFAAAIGTATFVEEKYDTLTARVFIYNAAWFEAILLLLALNFAGIIQRYHLFRKEKFPALLFHLAFIILILGAGITRYLGFEGTMHIREGGSSGTIFTADPYLQVKVTGDGGNYTYMKKMFLGEFTGKRFHIPLSLGSRGSVVLDYAGYVKNADGMGSGAIRVDVTGPGKKQVLTVYTGRTFGPEFQEADLGGTKLSVAYGPKPIVVPFSLALDDFILERYPGSMSPSSYASLVTLYDKRNSFSLKKRIYMNHVLDYDGYRFFQSSYDPDEKGTVLSVNHDFWGTWISYVGYILLGVGFLLTLLNRKSRFRTLSRTIRQIREERKAALPAVIFLFLLLNVPARAAAADQNPVNADHAEKFGHLLVQTFDGRFEPVHTMASDAIHKITKKERIRTAGKGDMGAVQVFLDMLIDPGFWRSQKIIYIRDKSVGKVIGIDGDYAAFNDFLGPDRNYKLASSAEQAFRKRPAEQNAFDKEVIKVDERVNILLTIFNGSLLRLFPLPGSADHKWISLADSQATAPMESRMAAETADLGLAEPSYRNLLQAYLLSVYEATITRDYSRADKILGKISSIQHDGTPPGLLPSPSRISAEIRYNKEHIFETLRNVYGLLSIVLLLLAFTDNLRSRKSRLIRYLMMASIAVLAAAFLYHTYGLGMRWYLTGHAPWSNGYEALLIIGWGSLLAGFSFMRVSKISLAATVLLAFFVLMTAGHSSYDPQLTNLQPVLKSYWLIIHVAVITISYGFLALGFILGLINLAIFLFRTKSNENRLGLIIRELTCTNEMSLLVGIVLATIGTFLGGVWANESWGRYWGWDAKETWALAIVMTYAIILHLRFVPKFKSELVFNAASVIGFGSVIMTFVGVNYYLSKGLHSYAADDTKVFPAWAWILILLVILLIVAAAVRDRAFKKGSGVVPGANE